MATILKSSTAGKILDDCAAYVRERISRERSEGPNVQSNWEALEQFVKKRNEREARQLEEVIESLRVRLRAARALARLGTVEEDRRAEEAWQWVQAWRARR